MDGCKMVARRIVDWLAKNSKSGRRRIRLAAKEEEKRKKLLDEHIAYVKMLRRAEVRILVMVHRFTRIFTKTNPYNTFYAAG